MNTESDGFYAAPDDERAAQDLFVLRLEAANRLHDPADREFPHRAGRLGQDGYGRDGFGQFAVLLEGEQGKVVRHPEPGVVKAVQQFQRQQAVG